MKLNATCDPGLNLVPEKKVFYFIIKDVSGTTGKL